MAYGDNDAFKDASVFSQLLKAGNKHVKDKIIKYVKDAKHLASLDFFVYVLESELGIHEQADPDDGVIRLAELPIRGGKKFTEVPVPFEAFGYHSLAYETIGIPLAKSGRFVKEESHKFSAESYKDDKQTTFVEMYTVVEGSAGISVEVFQIKGGVTYKAGTKVARRKSSSTGNKQTQSRSREFLITKYKREVVYVNRSYVRKNAGADHHTHVPHLHNTNFSSGGVVVKTEDTYDLSWGKSKRIHSYYRSYAKVQKGLERLKLEFLQDIVDNKM